MFRSLRAAVLVFVFVLGLIPAGLVLADSKSPAGPSFTDVPADHPDRPYIAYLAERKLINGYPDGRFGPTDPLNRAAAAKIATQVAGLAARQSGQPLTFSDLPGAHWSVPFVRAGVESGLIKGFEDNTFRPDEPLTRAQLAVLAVRATRQSEQRLPSLTLSDVKSSDWFYRQALLAVASGMMEAPSGAFRPNDVATRAEAARAFAQALVYTPLAFDTPLSVIVVPQRGVVEIQQPGETAWTKVTVATALQEGGRVRTAGASAAAVDFPDGSSLFLDNLTEMIVHRSHGTQMIGATGVEDLDVELVQGKLLFALTPRVTAEEAQAYAPALAAFNNPEADRRAAQAMAPRVRAAASSSGENWPDNASRLLLFVDPASLEPGDENGAELTIVLADEAGEPVTADKGPVTLELLSDVGRFSNAAPVIPEGYNAVTVTVYPPDDEPEDQKTRITAVAGEVTSALTVPTSKSSWWSNLFSKKTRAKVRMPWSVASVRGTIGSATVTPTENSTSLLNGDATMTSNNGDSTDVGQNQGASMEDADDSPDPGPLTPEQQETFSSNQDWINNTTDNQEQNSTDDNREVIDAHNQIVKNLVQNLPQDKVAPSIVIGSPADGQKVGTQTVTVSGAASDNLKLASVTVGGSSVGVSASGGWSTSVTLQPGPNTITATAVDGSGNTSSASITVIFDAAHPTITLSGPESTKEKKVTLTGSVTAPGGVKSVTVNGTAVTVGENGGSFSAEVELKPGVNAFTAEVTDKLDRTATAELQITSAGQPPLISINTGESVVGKPNYTVSGQATAQYAKLVSVTVNGSPVLFTADGAFSAPVKLKLGDNEITVTATDNVGNTASASTTVKLDAAAPTVRIQQPRDGFITKDAQISVQGVSTAALGVKSLTVNGQTLAAEPGSFSATVPLQEGENLITVELEGTSGRKATDTKRVIRVSKPPTLVVSSPESGQKSAKKQVTVSGAAAASFGPLRSVTVNGQSALLGAGGGFSTTVTLQNGENQITVVATDMAGNATTETRLVTFNPQAATVALSSPANGLITKQGSVTVSGSLTNGEDVKQVSINGVPAAVSGGSFSATVQLAPGKNTISVALPEDAGGGTDSVTVIYADRPPTLSVGAPSDGQISAKPEISVSGSAMTSYGTPAVVSVNGLVVRVSSGGSFSQTVQLKPGKNTISVSASDEAGNSASDTRTVEYKPALPLINISSPADGFQTKEARITVSGSVTSEIGVASVTVNGSAASVSANGSFSASVELKPGANTISITATDKAQQTANASITVQRGGVPPQLSIGSPSEGFVSGSRTVTVSGSAKAVAGKIASVTVNGSAAAVSPDGSWTASVTLNQGPNTISVTATDTLGGTASESRKVTVAEGAPTLYISSPADGTVVTQNKITVSGKVKASTPNFTVTVNGSAASAGSDGSFSATVELKPGPNTISLSVTDSLNRSASGSRTVIFAGDPPTISVSAPAQTTQAKVAVTGSAKVATGLKITSVTVNGSAASVDASGAFSAEVTLQKGSNSISATVTDSLGRSKSASTTVSFNPAAPTVSLNAPANTQSATVTVSGSVSSQYGQVTVSVGGQTFTYNGSGSFSATVNLAVGANTITATATDQYGSASATATVTYTQPAPPPPTPTAKLTVHPSPVRYGDYVTFTLEGASAAANKTVEFLLKTGDTWTSLGTSSAAADGRAEFEHWLYQPAGAYELKAVDKGTPSTTFATATLTVQPVQMEIGVGAIIADDTLVFFAGSAFDEQYTHHADALISTSGLTTDEDETDESPDVQVLLSFLDEGKNPMGEPISVEVRYMENGDYIAFGNPIHAPTFDVQAIGEDSEGMSLPDGTKWLKVTIVAPGYYTGEREFKLPTLSGTVSGNITGNEFTVSGAWSATNPKSLFVFGDSQTLEGSATSGVFSRNLLLDEDVDQIEMAVLDEDPDYSYSMVVVRNIEFRPPLSVTMESLGEVDYGDKVDLKATFMRGTTPVPGKRVRFQKGNDQAFAEVVTDENGLATYRWTVLAPASSTLPYYIHVVDSYDWGPVYDTKELRVKPEKVTLELTGGALSVGQTRTLTAKVVQEADGSPSSFSGLGVRVYFTFLTSQGRPVSDAIHYAEVQNTTTDGIGEAVLEEIEIPSQAASLVIEMANNPYYEAPGPVTVAVQPPTTSLTGLNEPVQYSDGVRIGFTLAVDGVPVAGRTVTLVVNGQTEGVSTTDEYGYTDWWYDVELQPRTEPYTVQVQEGTTVLATGSLTVVKEGLTMDLITTGVVVGETIHPTVYLEDDDGDMVDVDDLGAFTFEFQEADGKVIATHTGTVIDPVGSEADPYVDGGYLEVPVKTAKLVVKHAESAYYLAASIWINSPAPPTLTLTAPADNAVVNLPFVYLNGSFDAPSGVDVGDFTVNGESKGSYFGNGMSFDIVVNLNPGVNTIVVEVKDDYNRKATVTRTVTYEKPVAEVSNVTAQYSDFTSITATVKQGTSPLANFPVLILLDGDTVYSGATDAAGQVNASFVPINRPAGTYTISVVPIPAPSEVLGTGTATVTKETAKITWSGTPLIPGTTMNLRATIRDEDTWPGDLTQAGLLELKFTIKKADGTILDSTTGDINMCGDGYCASVLYPLPSNGVKVEVSLPTNGYFTAPSITVVADTTPPTVTVDPVDDISSSSITLTGTYSESVSAVRVNGANATYNNTTKTFSHPVTLAAEVNSFEIVVVDLVGNTTTVHTFVNYAPITTAPRIRLVPRNTPATVGSTLTVDVVVDNVPANLGSATVEIKYHTALLDATTVTVGPLLAHDANLAPAVNETAGTILVNLTNPDGPSSSSTLLATITFQVTAAGTADVWFENVTGLAPGGNVLLTSDTVPMTITTSTPLKARVELREP